MRHLKRRNNHTVHEILFSSQATGDLISQAAFIQAAFIYEKTRNAEIADRYLDAMRDFIKETLSLFPRAGRPAEEFGEGIRKLVYQRYSILYLIDKSEQKIVIVTLYRDNIPHI